LIILSIAKIDHGASIMHKLVLFSLFGCSASVALAIASNITTNTEPATTIPYPEVMNLSRVPTFDANGMVPQSNIANSSPKRSLQHKAEHREIPVPITIDLVSSTFREATIKQSGDNCASCRNLAPTVMVLGYSSDRAIGGLTQTMY
jgi:hypothetical protein